MTLNALFALLAFAFVTSVTPGPNNMMLLASGVNHGFRRTVPHMLGIALGHALMVFLVGLGLAELFQALPWLQLALKLVSVAYMLWLAWKIGTSVAPQGSEMRAKPFSFLQAAAFQWVNPKAWAMALGAVTLYAPDREVTTLAVLALAFCAVNLPSVSLWCAAGQGLRRWLDHPGRLRAFNWVMAGLLVLSLVPILTH